MPRLAAWWGHDLQTRFQMREKEFRPIEGVYGFRCSNPPVVCTATLLGSLRIFEEAKMERLREKSQLLTGYLEMLLERVDANKMKIITPKNPKERGCQLSVLLNVDLDQVMKEFQNRGIICDERKPNVIRVAPAPLYNSFSDVQQFVKHLSEILTSLSPLN